MYNEERDANMQAQKNLADIGYGQMQTPSPFQPQGIGWAVKNMTHGIKVRRRNWNGKGMWIAIQVPDLGSKMSQPYVYMSTVDGSLVPWLASQSDLLANDWEAATV